MLLYAFSRKHIACKHKALDALSHALSPTELASGSTGGRTCDQLAAARAAVVGERGREGPLLRQQRLNVAGVVQPQVKHVWVAQEGRGEEQLRGRAGRMHDHHLVPHKLACTAALLECNCSRSGYACAVGHREGDRMWADKKTTALQQRRSL